MELFDLDSNKLDFDSEVFDVIKILSDTKDKIHVFEMRNIGKDILILKKYYLVDGNDSGFLIGNEAIEFIEEHETVPSIELPSIDGTVLDIIGGNRAVMFRESSVFGLVAFKDFILNAGKLYTCKYSIFIGYIGGVLTDGCGRVLNVAGYKNSLSADIPTVDVIRLIAPVDISIGSENGKYTKDILYVLEDIYVNELRENCIVLEGQLKRSKDYISSIMGDKLMNWERVKLEFNNIRKEYEDKIKIMMGGSTEKNKPSENDILSSE
jgi:hypothetical protein